MNPDRQAMIDAQRHRPSGVDARQDDAVRSDHRDRYRDRRDDRDRDRDRDRHRTSRDSRRDRDRDISAPRHDRHSRISKPSTPQPSSSSASRSRGRFLTQDEQSEQFVADEDKFVLQQAKKKADIRVREARATPVDLLVFPLRYIEQRRADWDDEEDVLDIDVPEPTDVIATAAADPAKLADLRDEIASYRTLETNPASRDYWDAVHALCADALASTRASAADAVKADIDKILQPKSLDQLAALERQIRDKLAADAADIDVDYWEQLLRSLLVWKARARLAKISESMRHGRAALLRPRDPQKADALEAGALSAATAASVPTPAAAEPRRTSTAEKTQALMAAARAQSDAAPPPGTARFAHTGPEDFSAATKALYEREVARGIRDDEEIFAAEEAVPTSLAAGKYRARKPRYFNRVQMGYDWNKYNQTHYDHDNPPPKVVQGYKFNIFYPELLDKTKAPTFKIIREDGRRRGESGAAPGENDTCLIRFIAGAPYDDIAFRIVDREWDYSSKKERGFKSSFDNGILQLHFQFKRIFYRK